MARTPRNTKTPDSKEKENYQTPVSAAAPASAAKPLAVLTWRRAIAALFVAATSFYASPSFTTSFYGKVLIGVAKCVATDPSKTMGQCLSNCFNRVTGAASPNVPVTGTDTTAGNEVHPPANLPQETFHEDGAHQHQYDATGARVFPEAAKHRAEADLQAQLRSTKFAESQLAFTSGHKANAHELSREGKRHGRLMEEANQRAAQAILVPQNSDRTGVLDLHGLYVKEAEESTEEFLLKQKKAKRFREVQIITGAGHHSEGHHSRLRPAIERVISALDLPYHHPRRNDGAFIVEMFPNQELVDQLQQQ